MVSTYMSTGGWRLFDYWTSRVRPKAGGQPASYPPHVLIITIITIITTIEIIRTTIKIIITITVIRKITLGQIANFGTNIPSRRWPGAKGYPTNWSLFNNFLPPSGDLGIGLV